MRKGLDSLKGLILQKARIRRTIVSCQRRGAVFPHTLITGLGGTGKTVLSRAVAEELDVPFVEYEAAALPTRAAVIRALMQGDKMAREIGKPLAIFIDEVHRFDKERQEALYYPMVEHRITTKDGVLEFAPFTLFAATTRPDALDAGSFVTRCQNNWHLGRYDLMEICDILRGIFDNWGITHGPSEIKDIGRRCLGIPRIANNLAAKVRDQIYYRGGDLCVLPSDITDTFNLEELDSIGLSEQHRVYLMSLYNAGSRPCGLHTMSGLLSMSTSVVEDVIEPILLSLGFVESTSRGRRLTEKGRKHLIEECALV